MTIFDWPSVLQPRDILPIWPNETAGLNTSLSGMEQAVPVIRPPWKLRLTFDNLFGRELLAWRAIMGSLEGRANAVRIPLFDLWFQPGDTAIGGGGVPHSDGSPFSDQALYLVDDLTGVTVTAAQGDRVITADFGAYGEIVEAGLIIGLGEHPYLITSISWAGSVATIRTNPTMRQDYTAQNLRVRPSMVARLTEDDGGQLEQLLGRYGAPVLNLVERFDGPVL